MKHILGIIQKALKDNSLTYEEIQTIRQIYEMSSLLLTLSNNHDCNWACLEQVGSKISTAQHMGKNTIFENYCE